jgi:addiction module HigA family antidote
MAKKQGEKTYPYVPLFEREISPVHPGEILLEEFLKPLGLSQTEFAKKIGVHSRTVYDIVKGKRKISPEMAIKLSEFFKTTPQFWMNFQRDYDLWKAYKRLEKESKVGGKNEDSCSFRQPR